MTAESVKAENGQLGQETAGKSWDQPVEASFAQWMDSRVARLETRKYFTFSTMVIPASNIGPSHIHRDGEEIFFVIRGKMKVICEKDGETWETIVGERDLISVPPDVYRTEINIGDEDALMCDRHGAGRSIDPSI